MDHSDTMRRLYAALACFGLGVGGLLAYLGVQTLETVAYTMPRRAFADQYNYFGSVFMAVGYAGLLIWLHEGGLLGWLGRALAATGLTGGAGGGEGLRYFYRRSVCV